jgi:hypothetical protein
MKKIRHMLSEEQIQLLEEHCNVVYNGSTYYKLPFWIKRNEDDSFIFYPEDNIPLDLEYSLDEWGDNAFKIETPYNPLLINDIDYNAQLDNLLDNIKSKLDVDEYFRLWKKTGDLLVKGY